MSNTTPQNSFVAQSEIETQHETLKTKIGVLLTEIFKHEAVLKFKNTNYVFPESQTHKKHFEHKLKTFMMLDVYSKTFVTIHTRAKISLREIKTSNNFGFDSCELLRMVLTLSDSLRNKNLKSSRVVEREIVEKQPIIEQKIELQKQEEEKQIVIEKQKHISKRTKVVKENVSGARTQSQRIRDARQIDQLSTFDL